MQEPRLSEKVYDALRANAAKTTPDDDVKGKPIDHHQLEKVRKHVFDTTTSHPEAHEKMKALIAVHKNLYPGDGEADQDDK